jgi:hypothetical protein
VLLWLSFILADHSGNTIYQLELHPDYSQHTQFHAFLSFDLTLTGDSEFIWLQASDLSIIDLKIFDVSGNQIPLSSVNVTASQWEIRAVNVFQANIPYTLKVDYRGQISTDRRGLSSTVYTGRNGNERYIWSFKFLILSAFYSQQTLNCRLSFQGLCLI